MFGWGSDTRRKKAAKALEQQLRAGGDARALLDEVKPGDRPQVVHLAITALLFDDHHHDLAAALARAAHQLDVRGDDAGHSIASALGMVGDYAAAMAVCERMLDDAAACRPSCTAQRPSACPTRSAATSMGALA